jgi:hypothetical protein
MFHELPWINLEQEVHMSQFHSTSHFPEISCVRVSVLPLVWLELDGGIVDCGGRGDGQGWRNKKSSCRIFYRSSEHSHSQLTISRYHIWPGWVTPSMQFRTTTWIGFLLKQHLKVQSTLPRFMVFSFSCVSKATQHQPTILLFEDRDSSISRVLSEIASFFGSILFVMRGRQHNLLLFSLR